MKKNIFLTILFLLFLQHCNYSPIYSNNNKSNFNLEIVKIDGDNEMNSFVTSNLKKFKKLNAEKKFQIKINTEHNKEILVKDKKGKISSYLIINKINFEIINIKSNKNYSFISETKTSAKNNEFEFKEYESTLKRNFVNSKIQEFIFNLSNSE